MQKTCYSSDALTNMVNGQIRPCEVHNERLIKCFAQTSRLHFVPQNARGYGLLDAEIEVAKDRFLLSPLTLARLLEKADIRQHDRVLDIAPATGWSSAIIARLSDNVTALESDPRLVSALQENLRSMGIDTVRVVTGNLAKGVAAYAPYDVIIINGALDLIPDAISSQLAPNGRILGVISHRGYGHDLKKACLWTLHNGNLEADEFVSVAAADIPDGAFWSRQSFEL